MTDEEHQQLSDYISHGFKTELKVISTKFDLFLHRNRWHVIYHDGQQRENPLTHENFVDWFHWAEVGTDPRWQLTWIRWQFQLGNTLLGIVKENEARKENKREITVRELRDYAAKEVANFLTPKIQVPGGPHA